MREAKPDTGFVDRATDRAMRIYRWFRGREPLVLVAWGLIVATLWGFVEFSDDVLEGDTHAVDNWILRAMRDPNDLTQPRGPKFVQDFGQDVTALGGWTWLVFFTLSVAGYLWLDNKRRLTVLVLIASLSGLGISHGMKLMFDRPRPDVVPHLAHVTTSSYPSSHSMMAAVVYLTVGALVAAALGRTRLKLYVLSLAILLTILVGVSRVYLGVHYPSDVLAGWMAGLAWALICWCIARWLQVHGKIEADGPVRE